MQAHTFSEIKEKINDWIRLDYIQPEDIARLIAFRNNPSDESWIGGNK